MNNGGFYDLDASKGDQKDILAYCLNHVKKWIETAEDEEANFEPLRLTVSGVAGSGKSNFVQTLVTAIRTLFQNGEAVAFVVPLDRQHTVLEEQPATMNFLCL